MTPEQENDSVALFMGWEWLGGNVQLWHRNGVYTGSYPDYRTDPALLWELVERLAIKGWNSRGFPSYFYFINQWNDKTSPEQDTFPEAVFAAAVMQAEQERK